MTRSIRNNFAPINWVPPEVLSLIADDCDTHGEMIVLTHVCRSWRDIFISRTSLWTFLDCANLDRTSVYLERSKASPLKICLDEERAPFLNDTFSLTVPHFGRLKNLSLSGSSKRLHRLTRYLGSPAPLLEELEIRVVGARHAAIESTIFNGNLSSLRGLRLAGVLTNLPWQDLANLTTFEFLRVPNDAVSVTQLLDFFENAPLLRDIELEGSLPHTSDAPDERVVSLLHLRSFVIHTHPAHSTFLNHLLIPTDASVGLEFTLSGEGFQILDHLPTPIDNLSNISPITSINLGFGSGMGIRLNGSSGGLHMFGPWFRGGLTPSTIYQRILQSLGEFHVSTTERLTVTQYDASAHPETDESGAYQTLRPMNNLRTLTLIDCTDLPFLFALNPKHNRSNTVVCPKLEELVLYIRKQQDQRCVDGLLEMVKGRASRDARLVTVTVVCSWELAPAEVFGLRRYVSRVEHRTDDESPRWDTVPGEGNEIDHSGHR